MCTSVKLGLWSRVAAVVAVVAMTSGLVLAGSTAATSATEATHKATTSAAAKLDINSAGKADLAKLPGIGDAYSQKIIDGRPYKSKAELESKKILPKGVYDKISSLIIAHQK